MSLIRRWLRLYVLKIGASDIVDLALELIYSLCDVWVSYGFFLFNKFFLFCLYVNFRRVYILGLLLH